MILRNRIVMPPMVTNFSAPTGEVTERLIRYLERRSQGGVGLIIVEGAYISKEGQGFAGEVGLHQDELIPRLEELAERVKASGAKIAVQLIHCGRQTRKETTGCPIVAPSAVPCPVVQQIPRPLSRGDIAVIVQQYAQAAYRAKEAGFDALEVHGAHGYLIHQFLSPLSNQREDEYGGSRKGRVRFALEVVGGIRAAVGLNFPIIFRIDADEFLEGGIDLDLSIFYCEMLAPQVDALHISAGSYGSRAWIVQPYFYGPGRLIPLAGQIKNKVRVPIIAVGRIHTPELAESVLGRGEADFIAIGRQLLADPDFPAKAEASRTEDITPCLSCCIGCTDRLRKNLDISCLVNPLVGKESCRPPRLKGNPHCLIVGAGPAGMSAALVLAQRGARVTLVEEKSEVGGQFLWAAKVNFKQPFARIIQVYQKRLQDLGVEIVTRKATAEWVMDQNAEFTILATGSLPSVPPIPGLGASRHVTFGEALEKGVREGKVLIVGGGPTGCEVAELLLGQGKRVILTEILEELAGDMGNARPLLLERLSERGLEAHMKTVVQGIQRDEILLWSDGVTRTLKGIECVVLACGVVPNKQLECDLRTLGFAVMTIGDCQRPQNGFWAIRAGFELGISLEEKR